MHRPHPKTFDLANEAIDAITDFKRAVRVGDKQLAGALKLRAISLMEWADIFHTHPVAAEASWPRSQAAKEGSEP